MICSFGGWVGEALGCVHSLVPELCGPGWRGGVPKPGSAQAAPLPGS